MLRNVRFAFSVTYAPPAACIAADILSSGAIKLIGLIREPRSRSFLSRSIRRPIREGIIRGNYIFCRSYRLRFARTEGFTQAKYAHACTYRRRGEKVFRPCRKEEGDEEPTTDPVCLPHASQMLSHRTRNNNNVKLQIGRIDTHRIDYGGFLRKRGEREKKKKKEETIKKGQRRTPPVRHCPKIYLHDTTVSCDVLQSARRMLAGFIFPLFI